MERLLGETIQESGAGTNNSLNDDHEPFGVFLLDGHEGSQDEIYQGESQVAAPRPDMNILENDLLAVPDMNWVPGSAQHMQPTTLGPELSLTPLNPSPSLRGSLALGPFSLPSFHDLPSQPLALELVDDAFKSFNDYFPLFDKQDFQRQFQTHYPYSSPSNPAWWACINVVLALAYRFRSMRTLETAYENAQACGYMRNAVAVVSELTVLQHSLPAIQAIVGIAIVLQGTQNPHVASVLTAAAVRLAQAMGLHRKTHNPNLLDSQAEQGRRVFWIAYLLDKDISLRMGQPFAQDDDDMDAELPTETPYQLSLCADRACATDFFRLRIGLAIIQGQIYKRLYSVQASRQSEAQRAAVAQDLNSILSYWRSGVQIDFEDDPAAQFQVPLTTELIHMLILRFTYVNCLVMIYRHVSSREQLQLPRNQGCFIPSEDLCVIESRKAIRLIQITPHGDYACVWLLLHPFFAAVSTLLENVVRYPESAQARSDLATVKPFLELLDILVDDERQCSRSEEVTRMHQVCRDLKGKAVEAVESAERGRF
ncbi:hypothetical protein ACJZ2D_006715 [Fusarium nematophilum]